MKKQKLIYTFLTLIVYSFINYTYSRQYTNQYKDTEKINDIQQINRTTDLDSKMLSHFFKQPRYTEPSVRCFIKHTYNNLYYAQKFLSVNFSHIITFLSYSNKNPFPRHYIYKIFNLFKQKLSSTPFVNAYAFEEFLDQAPALIKPYFNNKREKREKINIIKEFFYNFLVDNFDELKKKPRKTITDFSVSIYSLLFEQPNNLENIEENIESDILISELQYIVVAFLEIVLSRLIWSSIDNKEIWPSIKQISYYLEELLVDNIIPNIEILDGLFWSLINRFCYFLEINGTELPVDFYQKINKEISTEKLPLWTLREAEPFIIPKLRHLQHALVQAEVKSRAYQAGIIANLPV